jgi:hypothetical protein
MFCDIYSVTYKQVPRTNEEGGEDEEPIGANAMLNRNIRIALSSWQKALWKLPCCCEGTPPENVYKKLTFDVNVIGSVSAATLLNRHALEKIRDTQLAESLNKKFSVSVSGSAAPQKEGESDRHLQLQSRIVSSLQHEKKKKPKKRRKKKTTGTDTAGEADLEDDEDSDVVVSSTLQESMRMSLPELLNSIKKTAKCNDADERGSRFSHATVFSQEDSLSIAAEAVAVSLMNVAGSSSSSGGFSSVALSAEHAARLQRIQREGLEAAQKFAAMDLQDRKAQQEMEEQNRQEQLQSVKTEVAELQEVGASLSFLSCCSNGCGAELLTFTIVVFCHFWFLF